MKLLPKLAALVALINVGVLPVSATVDPNTGNLIRTIESKGYTVTLEPCPGNIQGWMNHRLKKMVICDHSDLGSADAHDTVRHEGWHIVQSCKAGGDLAPVLTKRADFVRFVEGNLPQETIQMVTRTYSTDKHAIELEAWTAARVMTAAQVMTALNTYC